MKIIFQKTDNLLKVERYNLDNIYSESESNKGLLICYILAISNNIELVSIKINVKNNKKRILEKEVKEYTGDAFKSDFITLEDFLKTFDNTGLGKWEIKLVYQYVEVVIVGGKDKAEIEASYEKDRKIHLIKLFYDIESTSYKYNNYDENLINIFKIDYKMTDLRAVLSIKKLERHKDIFEEFLVVTRSGNYIDEANAIKVEGFNAKNLNTNYPLSVLGAYNYLIYLRESPEEALEYLRRGLPRK